MPILNDTVINLINIRYQAKNAHWNCAGFLFYQFHLLFDKIYDEYEDIIDRLAERSRGQGIRVTGTISQIAAATNLDDQAIESSAINLAKDLLGKINVLREINLKNISSEKDQTTLNMLTEVQELLDTHKYLLESSLA